MSSLKRKTSGNTKKDVQPHYSTENNYKYDVFQPEN